MGLITNPSKARRFIDFEGFNEVQGKKGRVYASDIDCIQEFSNKYLIITEIKEHGAPLRTGQRLLLERLVDAWNASGEEKKAVALYATHDPSLLEKVPVMECTVKKAYCGGDWKDADVNLVEALQNIGEKWSINKLKKK